MFYIVVIMQCRKFYILNSRKNIYIYIQGLQDRYQYQQYSPSLSVKAIKNIKLNINFGGAGRQLGPAVTKGGWGQLSQAGSCGQQSHVPSLVHFKKPSTVVLLLQFSVYNFTSSSRWPNQNQISVQHISARTSCWKLAITASAALATAAAAGRLQLQRPQQQLQLLGRHLVFSPTWVGTSQAPTIMITTVNLKKWNFFLYRQHNYKIYLTVNLCCESGMIYSGSRIKKKVRIRPQLF